MFASEQYSYIFSYPQQRARFDGRMKKQYSRLRPACGGARAVGLVVDRLGYSWPHWRRWRCPRGLRSACATERLRNIPSPRVRAQALDRCPRAQRPLRRGAFPKPRARAAAQPQLADHGRGCRLAFGVGLQYGSIICTLLRWWHQLR